MCCIASSVLSGVSSLRMFAIGGRYCGGRTPVSRLLPSACGGDGAWPMHCVGVLMSSGGQYAVAGVRHGGRCHSTLSYCSCPLRAHTRLARARNKQACAHTPVTKVAALESSQLRAVVVVGCWWLWHPWLFLGAQLPGWPRVVRVGWMPKAGGTTWSCDKPVAVQQTLWVLLIRAHGCPGWCNGCCVEQ